MIEPPSHPPPESAPQLTAATAPRACRPPPPLPAPATRRCHRRRRVHEVVARERQRRALPDMQRKEQDRSRERVRWRIAGRSACTCVCGRHGGARRGLAPARGPLPAARAGSHGCLPTLAPLPSSPPPHRPAAPPCTRRLGRTGRCCAVPCARRIAAKAAGRATTGGGARWWRVGSEAATQAAGRAARCPHCPTASRCRPPCSEASGCTSGVRYARACVRCKHAPR